MKVIELIDAYEIEPVEVVLDGVPTLLIDLALVTRTSPDPKDRRTWPTLRLPLTIARDLANALQLALQHCEDLRTGGSGMPM